MSQVIVFDLDDTLYAESDFVLSGFREVGNWVRDVHGISGFYEAAEKLFLDGIRGTIFNEASTLLGMDSDQHTIQTMLQLYRSHHPRISLYADAVWALEYYGTVKRLGVITDGYLETQKNKVQSLGIAGQIPCIVYSDEHGRENWKPSRIPYLKMMDYYDFQACEYVYVGDNPAKDFVAANELGWKTIRINRRFGLYHHLPLDRSYEAHFVISSLFELKNLID
ncbi:MAG: HAD-superfamily hydrolase, subfamily variant 1 [Paenibacillus sp.]|jgi:putative hydrolase of the HAD superfamily|uniref:HAD family hydrolase n=1 Tax=Paenibacillus hemerocallicola TaxID=1172614 RepID=A0A5C4TCK1_9BACL|nr:HAD family hydrolase [Paenibacillus hemerocallicola]MDF2714751.1 HAD-superfamily hydrolase, subfamily variant 1 [Paenibacillus sp.]TNJ66701.1 HAD family hydrolase [Paenibacillus hemerocallicola]